MDKVRPRHLAPPPHPEPTVSSLCSHLGLMQVTSRVEGEGSSLLLNPQRKCSRNKAAGHQATKDKSEYLED